MKQYSYLLGRVHEISSRLNRYRDILVQLPCSPQRLSYELFFADEADQLLHVLRDLADLSESNSVAAAEPTAQPIIGQSSVTAVSQPTVTPEQPTAPSTHVFTVDELSQYNGSGGQPAYVAVNGIVYDLSLQATWGGGSHFGLLAGRDLTDRFAGCHGQAAILSRLPVVGTLASGTGGQTT